MWYLSLLPSIVFHAILAAGLLCIFVSMVLKVVPFVSTYYIPIRIAGFVLFVVGVYFEGAIGIQAAMMERVKEMEAKVAAAEAESKKENIKIQEKIVYKYIPQSFVEEEESPVYVSEIFKTMFSQPSTWIDSIDADAIRRQEGLNNYFISQI